MLSSMRAQTATIIVVAFVLSNLAGYALYHADRQDAIEMTEALEIAERAAGVSRLLRDLPPEWASDVAAASDSRGFRVLVSPTLPFDAADPSDEETEIEDYLRSLLPRISGTEMRVRVAPATGFQARWPATGPNTPPVRSEPAPNGRVVAIAILHPDGQWLNFIGTVNTPEAVPPEYLVISLILTTIVIALAALWLVRRITGPLKGLAEAADRLGKDIHVEPLKETGPTEVAKAAVAFNRMQHRLLRLVADRTAQLAAISHDLRTPITQLRLRAELQPPSDETRKNLEALDHMEATVDTFLDFARAVSDPEKRSRIDLGALVESICSDYSDSGNEVQYEGSEGLLVTCKRLALRRAVSNLIDNALKYGQRARVNARQANGDIVIRIEDDGPGIPEHEIESAFLPFHRGDRSRGSTTAGSGLGLSIAKAVAEDHGGQINLSNRREGGLAVELILPS